MMFLLDWVHPRRNRMKESEMMPIGDLFVSKAFADTTKLGISALTESA